MDGRSQVTFRDLASRSAGACKDLSLREIRVILAFHDIHVPNALERGDFEEALRKLAWELGTPGSAR